MAKLSSALRARAQSELAAGASNADIVAKYGITASAVSYLRKVVTGTTPELTAFFEEFSLEQQARVLHLQNCNVPVKHIAEDYEVTTALMNKILKLLVTNKEVRALYRRNYLGKLSAKASAV